MNDTLATIAGLVLGGLAALPFIALANYGFKRTWPPVRAWLYRKVKR